MDDRALIEIIGTSTHEFFKEKEMIIRQGDPGDKFYLILKGKVSINLPNKKHEDASKKIEKIKEKG